jgi:hypothetical protein
MTAAILLDDTLTGIQVRESLADAAVVVSIDLFDRAWDAGRVRTAFMRRTSAKS